ncbi:anion transporter [Legionella israelensis]|uniref:SLC13 family permease n=1 Tax=Legionella israelensis TaxID=454 RepID=UPI00117EB969|nr:SLC13 family permease [Legionella israelensis]QDP71523.1 anion transporter [Legionella israelensis]
MSAFDHPPLPIIVLFFVFLGISFRKIGSLHLPIWFIMTLAALLVLITGQIGLMQAIRAVNLDVIFYLLGVFIIGQALEESNYLEQKMLKLMQRFTNVKWILGLLIVFSSFTSMLLMNDTIAIIATPAILLLHQRIKLPLIPLLLTLAFSITIGSIASPIGNPQNLLIAMEMTNPFMLFFQHLFIPTLICLLILYFYMWFCFRDMLNIEIRHVSLNTDIVVDRRLAFLAKLSLGIMLLLILSEITFSLSGYPIHLSFSMIALLAASPLILFSHKRFSLMRKIDWHTIVFFIALFVFMEAVWLSGYFQNVIQASHLQITAKSTIIWVSLLLSQLISNVPLVALYLPLLAKTSAQHYLLLAMASTIAGNMLILGAASNIIIIQNTEKRGKHAFNFWQFMCFGIPLTVINVIVYYLFLY